MSARQALSDAVAQIRRALDVIEKFGESPHLKGYAFEREFIAECRGRGLRVRKGDGAHVDVNVCGKRVQCKCVTPNALGQVFLQPGQRTWYMPADFDVLAMRCVDSLFLIPMDALPKTNGHVRIQIKPSQFRRFVDAWGVFGDSATIAEPCLFDPNTGLNDGR